MPGDTIVVPEDFERVTWTKTFKDWGQYCISSAWALRLSRCLGSKGNRKERRPPPATRATRLFLLADWGTRQHSIHCRFMGVKFAPPFGLVTNKMLHIRPNRMTT